MPKGPLPEVERALRIWVVEDNPGDAAIARRVIEELLACEVEIFGDGESALAALEEGGRAGRELPALILLDLGLPGQSGVEVLRRLRAQPVTALLPVVILTASGDEDEAILACYGAGANDLLPKPATREKLRGALRQLAPTRAAEGDPSPD